MPNESTTQMSLAHSARFLDRVQYLLVQQARVLLPEAPDTAPVACHYARVAYAQEVVRDPAATASTAAVMLVGGPNLIGTVLSDPDPSKIDTSASDGALLAQIAAYWPLLARCASGG